VSGIRVRTTIAAVLVVGLALVVAAGAMARFVEHSLTAAEGDQAEVRAQQIARQTLAEGTAVPVSAPDDEFVQVIEGRAVIASSTNVLGSPPLSDPAPGERERIDAVPFTDGPFISVGLRMETPAGVRTVVVGRSIDDAVEAGRTVVRASVVGGPVLLMLIGFVTWMIVGRALAPVDRMRREVDRISSRELHRRVPVPTDRNEIGRLATTMNRMLDRLERGNERERRFVSDASHELRSPLASIRQHSEVARTHPETTDVTELAELVLDEGARMQGLVDDLLLLARLDEGARLRTDDEIDLDDVMLAEATRLRGSTALQVDTVGVSAVRMRGDRAHLERMLRNVTDNAARYANARAAVSLAQVDGRVVIHVDDDGPGIPEAERERVFERFVRLDDARGRATGGTGLGLAIAHEIAVAHGGSMTSTRSPLGGLRIEVRLPAAD
jgi:signal transduction histidine kinase